MKRKIRSILICFLLLTTVLSIITSNAEIQNSTPQQINIDDDTLFINLNTKNWSYKNSDKQLHVTRNNTEPCIGILSSYKSPLHQLKSINAENITTINEESSNQVLVIKLSSANEIKILNFTAEFNLSIIDKQKTDYSHKYGVYLLDPHGKIHDYASLSWITGPSLRSLRYIKLGSFICDKRIVFEKVGWVSTGKFTILNYLLPAGEWYLVFYAGFYDVPNTNTNIHTNISIHIIEIADDLNLTKNEEGTFYGLWYGEFNPDFALTKGWAFDAMINGTAQFSIKHTFFFRFDAHPLSNGIWNVTWKTPIGIKHCKIQIKNGLLKSFNNEENVDWYIFGNGSNGNYQFTTSYIDRWNRTWWAFPIYLSAIDVALKK